MPEPTPLRRPDGDHAVEHSLDRARDRMRRRITGVGEPVTFGGRHHSTYREEIAAMFALGQVLAVEELLLGLLDAVEDEVAERQWVRLDPTFFLTLADLYQDSGRTEDLHALRERFGAAEERARSMPADDPVPDDGLSSLVPKRATVLAGEGRTAPPWARPHPSSHRRSRSLPRRPRPPRAHRCQPRRSGGRALR